MRAGKNESSSDAHRREGNTGHSLSSGFARPAVRYEAKTGSYQGPKHYLGDAKCETINLVEILGDALALAGARCTAGIYHTTNHQPIFTLASLGDPCTDYQCKIDKAAAKIYVCADWGNRAMDVDVIALVAALVSGHIVVGNENHTLETGIVGAHIENADAIANWVVNRYNAHHWMTCTTFTDWDERPDCSRLPILERSITYEIGPTNHPSRRDKIQRAWDIAWMKNEAAWRYLTKMAFNYLLVKIDHGEAEADSQIEHMWNFGGKHINGTHGETNYKDAKPLENHLGTQVCKHSAPREDLDWCGGTNNKQASLSAFFGDYTHERFLTVYWTMCAVMCRYQGHYYDYYMGNGMWHTKFFVNMANNRSYSHPTGEIWLGARFFRDKEDWWKHGVEDATWESTEQYRQRTIIHESFHYLVREDAGGRPRDVWDNSCDDPGDDDDNNKCYGEDASIKLAIANKHEALKNVSNYEYWITNHYDRWCGDWPPDTDRQTGTDVYHPDPITDDIWSKFLHEWWEATDPDFWWSLVATLRDEMNLTKKNGGTWKPFFDPDA